MKFFGTLLALLIGTAVVFFGGWTAHESLTQPVIAKVADATGTNSAKATNHAVEITVKGSGMEELDGFHFTERPFTDDEKIMIRGLLKLAQMKGGKHLLEKPGEKK